MTAAKPAESYGAGARLLHWASAALVLVMLGLGVAMVRWVTDLATKVSLYQLHKSLGMTVLAVTLVRLAWRWTHARPPYPASMAPWETRAAGANHMALYVLLIALPLSGWAMVSASTLPIPTVLFGWLPLPHIGVLAELTPERKKAIEPLLKDVHFVLAITLASLVALHIAAALRHQLVLKDGLLRRMWPARKRSASSNGLLVCVLSAALVGGSSAAAASTWVVDGEKSALTFEISAGGQTVRGRFERFTAHIAFEPSQPDRTRIDVTIDTASTKTGQAEVDQGLKGADWFDVARFPETRFRAADSRGAGNGRFELLGELTIRGTTQPLVVPFTLEQKSRHATARGEATVQRSRFGIGPASVAGVTIGDDVTIRLKIHAERAE
ncbi:MAG: YceI family protein [Hyphomicrobiales bacterium]|nr:YceI family protein [Hyphomicrobiales bacterium]